MNNFNIYLEIRNPKKQAVDTKLEAMACYLTNRRIDDQSVEERITGNHRVGNERLGLGLDAKSCDGQAMQCRGSRRRG